MTRRVLLVAGSGEECGQDGGEGALAKQGDDDAELVFEAYATVEEAGGAQVDNVGPAVL